MFGAVASPSDNRHSAAVNVAHFELIARSRQTHFSRVVSISTSVFSEPYTVERRRISDVMPNKQHDHDEEGKIR